MKRSSRPEASMRLPLRVYLPKCANPLGYNRPVPRGDRGVKTARTISRQCNPVIEIVEENIGGEEKAECVRKKVCGLLYL